MAPNIPPHSLTLILYKELSSPKKRHHQAKIKEGEEKCVEMKPLPFYV
jgi:hypothetical protein